MRWDRFFEDLEDQLDSEWEAERAALDSEAERLRLARLSLFERVNALTDAGAGDLLVDVKGGASMTGRPIAAGPDWLALDDRAPRGVLVVPFGAVVSLGASHADVLRSARGGTPSRLRERMTLGFVLRDLARRRVPVTLLTTDGREYSGTIDRAASDHLDLALHDRGAPRRADLVAGHRLVPFGALAGVRLDSPVALA
ncbi:hypothetical protein SAMN05216488_1666 [Microbacterium sp. LKL04]|uniref:hypothetical protein n=1 Tax=Microbacterium sp. LKL04 TaxID=912630 RepID=UPI000875B9B9|nr:hypothetical protein [Microbacterium sp. LKL04]SCY40179.1 hypothetical protein SAMN05216488_1666 [Microbacterium sp. LKL04]